MRWLASLALVIALAACGEPAPYVRACNDAGSDMTSLAWGAYSATGLAAGACTEYEQPEDPVYRYTYVRFTVDGVEYTLQPIDFVGEERLDDGHWSYRLGIGDVAMRRVDLTLERDD
jgi:hypothetical protein